MKKVYGSPTVTLQQLQRSEISIEGSVRVTYSTKDGFKKSAKALGLMDDFKVIEISIKKNRELLILMSLKTG